MSKRLLTQHSAISTHASAILGMVPLAIYPMNETSGTSLADLKGGTAATANNLTLANLSYETVSMGKSALYNGSTSYVQLPASSLNSAGFSAATGTISMWIHLNELWSVSDQRVFLTLGGSVNNQFLLQKTAANTIGFAAGYGGTFNSTTVAYAEWGLTNIILTWDRPAQQMKCYANNVQIGSTVTLNGTWSGTLADAWSVIGKYNSGLNWPGWIGWFTLFNRVVSADERAVLRATIPQAYQVICDGNSLTVGFPLTALNAYPTIMSAALGQVWKVTNLGVSGQTTADMIADAATQVDVLYSSSFAKNVVVCWEGTNSIWFGANATTTYNDIVSYCTGRRAAGFKVVVCNILPRTPFDGTQEGYRTTVNSNIASNWATFADARVDVAGDSRLSNAANTTYYQADGIHLTDAGYAVAAELIGAAVLTL